MKDKDIPGDDIVYHRQTIIEQCRYGVFSNNTIIHPDLVVTDTGPDKSDESEEEEINENTVFDE